jgi:hypothetical protein
MRAASTPKRIATPYNSNAIVGNGAFGCTGSRLPARSQFELVRAKNIFFKFFLPEPGENTDSLKG